MTFGTLQGDVTNRDLTTAIMLFKLIDALEASGSKLQHVYFTSGGKHYGMHLGPVKTPMDERDSRHMPPNMYYVQVLSPGWNSDGSLQRLLAFFCYKKVKQWAVVLHETLPSNRRARHAFHCAAFKVEDLEQHQSTAMDEGRAGNHQRKWTGLYTCYHAIGLKSAFMAIQASSSCWQDLPCS